MKKIPPLRYIQRLIFVIVILAFGSGAAYSQAPPPAWGFTQYFKYNIEDILVNTTVPGSWNVKVIFSITNPVTSTSGSDPTRGIKVWDIKRALPYSSAGAGLSILFGWDPEADFSNLGSTGPSLASISTTALGTGAAMPVQARGLNSTAATGASECTRTDCPGLTDLNNRFWVQRTLTPVAFKQAVAKGRVGIEGRPVCNGLVACPAPGVGPTGRPVYANIPVRSETADFTFVASTTPVSAMIPDARRKVVDFATKCWICHNGIRLDGNGTPIPRLSLHGNNRNENLNLCVMCHNPNQTDVPFKLVTADPLTSAAEVSVDFKRMIHGIHAGEFRTQPLIVVGFNTSIHDYRDVRFPARLRDCTTCHVDDGRKGSFELPLPSTTPGTTIATGSVYAVPAGTIRTIDVNAFNDLKITPTAATCSGCHDKAEVRSHMIRTGRASFGTQQQNIGTRVVERCANCHGPGKEEDVRKAHEIRRSSGSDSTSPSREHHDD